MNIGYWNCNFPLTLSIGWSVCHKFLKGQEVTLPCSYRSTYFYFPQPMMMMFVNETEADDHPEPDSSLLIGDSYVTKYTSLLCSYFVRLLSQICLLAPIAPRSICFYFPFQLLIFKLSILLASFLRRR